MSISFDDPLYHKPSRDRQGNLWLEDKIIKPSPAGIHIDNEHFWCVICKDVKPLTVEGGLQSGLEIGGWMCNAHENQGK